VSLSFFIELFPQLVDATLVTIALWVLSSVFGNLLAIPVAIMRVSPRFLPRWSSRIFVTVIRGTPLLVQVYILYYGLGNLLARMPLVRTSIVWPLLRDGFWYAFAALTISAAAYSGEILRGGIEGVPRGEIEAGRSLGLSRWHIWRLIVLPRAIRIALPSLGGQTINLLKSTALASTITVMDVLGTANYIRMQTFRVYEPLLAASIIYVALTLLFTRLLARIERPAQRFGDPSKAGRTSSVESSV